MRICVVDYAGHPFQVQLSRKLAACGHDVLHLYFGKAVTPRGFLTVVGTDPRTLGIESVSIQFDFRKYSYVRRWWQEQLLGASFVRRVDAFRPDITIVANAPLEIVRALQRRFSGSKAGFVLWQQDVYSVAITSILEKRLGVLGSAFGMYYRRMEGRALNASDAIVVISPSFKELDVSTFGIDPRKVTVIPNWASVDDIRPGPTENEWSRTAGLNGRKLVIYSGTLGNKHNPDRLLHMGDHLERRGDATLLVISEGLLVERLREVVLERRLSSIVFKPFQPPEVFSDVLASSTALVAILEEDAGVFSVPSKVLSYLCAGRPILLCAPRANLASQIVLEAQAGFVHSAAEFGDLLRGLDRILDDEGLASEMGHRARSYATEHFDIDAISEKFLVLFHDVLARGLELNSGSVRRAAAFQPNG